MLTPARSTCVKFLPLLLALGLLFVQAVGQQHLHLDEVQGASCQVCAQADTTPGLASSQQTLVPAPAFEFFVPTPANRLALTTQRPYQTRAPPLA